MRADDGTSTGRSLRLGIAGILRRVDDQIELAKVAERAGYHLVGIGDTQNIIPEAFVTLTAMAAATERIRLATTVANPVTRHVAVTAAAMSSLQAASGGRAVYGVGTGDSAVANLGLPHASLRDLEAHCRTFRALVAGKPAACDGHPVQLQWETHPVPVLVAAGGPKTLRLAGRVADGVICGNGISREVVESNLDHIAAGAREAGRSPDDIEVWHMAKIVVAGDEREAWDRYAWTLASSANHTLRSGLRGKLVPEEVEPGLAAIRAGYDSRLHSQMDKGDLHSKLVRDSGLTEWLGRRFLIAGPPDHIRSRVDELASWGAPNLILTAIFGSPLDYTQEMGEVLLG
ncbi:MAG TPA: LLM class flavin-dependent oxidoreductase [Acidimicrobiales bacterium]